MMKDYLIIRRRNDFEKGATYESKSFGCEAFD